MAGAWLQWALEQAANAEDGTNPVSSDGFFLKADSIEFDDGSKLLKEEGKTVGALGRAKHLGIASYKPKVSVKGVYPRPSDLGLILYAWCGLCATTPGGDAVTDPDGDPVPVGAFKHVFDFASADPQTSQLLLRDAGGKFFKLSGGGVESVDFTLADGVFSYSAALLGLFGGELPVDPQLTPGFDLSTPFRQGDMTLTWAEGSAVTKAFDVNVAAGIETDKSVGTASDYPDVIMFGNDEASLPDIKGTITKRSLADADWDAFKLGTQFAAKIKLAHREDIGLTGRKSAVWFELPGCQHIGYSPDAIANVRRREVKIDWQATIDEATEKLATITLVNGTAAYATYA